MRPLQRTVTVAHSNVHKPVNVYPKEVLFTCFLFVSVKDIAKNLWVKKVTEPQLTTKDIVKLTFSLWYFLPLMFRYEIKRGFATWLQNYKQMRISDLFPAAWPRYSTGNATKTVSLEHDLNVLMRKGIQYCIKLSHFFSSVHCRKVFWWSKLVGFKCPSQAG